MRPLVLALLVLALPVQAQTAEVRVLMAGETKDDLAEVLALAKRAEHRLWVFAYTLSDATLIEILAEKAAQPGFDLRVLIDRKQHTKNKGQLKAISAAVTPVVVPDSGRMHSKLMLIDTHTVLMGSKNWSDLPNVLKWNDVVVLRAGKRLVAQVEGTFQRVGGFKSKPLPKTKATKLPDAERAKVELHFSAPGNPGARTRAALLALIKRAKLRIHLGMFILSDPELVKAIWLKRERVEIRIVVDAIQHANLGKRVDAAGKGLQRQLKDLGPAIRMSGDKQVHHKLALLDDVVVTGSANWSKAAWEKNHEAVLILAPKRAGSPGFVEAYRARLEALWESATGL
jgi:phosphatidylserine/phosphatidylglycerophosphate/cardiolipin synthase-like enzyme